MHKDRCSGTYAGGHPETNEMDRLMNCLGVLPAELEAASQAIIKFGRMCSKMHFSVPDDKNLQDECAYIPIQVEGWMAGFGESSGCLPSG